VLIPTDFSEPAGEVLSFLKDIKGIDTVILLNVIDTRKNDPHFLEYRNVAKTKLGEIGDKLIQSGFHVENHVRTGYPPDEIISLAETNSVTLIAMSPHGEGWLREVRELFVGSTTDAVVRRAGLPVIIIRGKRFKGNS